MKYVNCIEKQFGKSVNDSILFQNMLVKNRNLTVLNNDKMKKSCHHGSRLSLIFPSNLPPKSLCMAVDTIWYKDDNMQKFAR